MTFSVEITDQAKNDLRDVFEYIAFELCSMESAIGQLSRLEKRIGELSQMPERYRRYDREPWFTRNLRVMPVDHYLVFYIPDASRGTVTVIRVMYGGRDVHAQLDESDTG